MTTQAHGERPHQLCRGQLVHRQVTDGALKPTREGCHYLKPRDNISIMFLPASSTITGLTKHPTKLLSCIYIVFILFNRWSSSQYSPPTLFWELLPSWAEQAFFLWGVVVDAPLSQMTSVHRQNETISAGASW